MLTSNIVNKIMDFEAGSMNNEDVIPFFQELIDSGLAWQLQGGYGRAAARLLQSGECHSAKKLNA